MWQVRCAKVDQKRVWAAFFSVMSGVIREAIRRANQSQKDEDDEESTIDDEDADEDYDFGQDTPVSIVCRDARCRILTLASWIVISYSELPCGTCNPLLLVRPTALKLLIS